MEYKKCLICGNDYQNLGGHIKYVHNLKPKEYYDLYIKQPNGKDLYNPNDFNKNNMIDNIPIPQIIYKDLYTIYGAGKLY